MVIPHSYKLCMIKNNSPLACLLLLVLIATTTCKLFISSPTKLVEEIKQKYPEGIPYSIANYGDVPFGTTLSGTVFIPEVL